MDSQLLRNILESCLLVAGRAMNLQQLEKLFVDDIDRPNRADIKAALVQLQAEYQGRGIELVEVSSGWRLQSRQDMAHWVGQLFQEKPPRYSRALLETLVLIAYRQPITRGEIEEIRGVAVSSNIIRTLLDREWIREVGQKEVPGRPSLWGTTKQFLDYFNLQRLDEMPTLAEARDLAEIEATLAAEVGPIDGATNAEAANDSDSTSATDEHKGRDEALNDQENSPEQDNSELVNLAGGLPGASAEPPANSSYKGESPADAIVEANNHGASNGLATKSEPVSEDGGGQAQTALRTAIDEFATEHQRQIEAQNLAQKERVPMVSTVKNASPEIIDEGVIGKPLAGDDYGSDEVVPNNGEP